ncbi:sulfotransferase family protein [Halioglobus maricola]|uniref:Sulfotransferase family protein n=1 Tax=Halioglobus maricola TaxID=2601894 RepID=A0A5P9NG49_9GAMM|nr:sulfotransferase family protein [Halioglobus maricola]QFU74761.1 sulfotransferase family protein [Halioglobus maricola]
MSSTQIAVPYSESPQKIVCVLGMHRSGTSCLTGSMQVAGLELGDHSTWNPHNLKGNRENQHIVDINDAVLEANGAAWDSPAESVIWPEAQLDAARALFREYAQFDKFGFKDPRTLLTIGGWQSLFPQMQYIGIFRHPMVVAQSLHNRSELPLETGLSLWLQYNRRLLREYRKQPFPILCFDEPQDIFQEKLRKALNALGLTAGEDTFYEQQLKSAQGGEGTPLPWNIRRLYRKLQRLAE